MADVLQPEIDALALGYDVRKGNQLGFGCVKPRLRQDMPNSSEHGEAVSTSSLDSTTASAAAMRFVNRALGLANFQAFRTHDSKGLAGRTLEHVLRKLRPVEMEAKDGDGRNSSLFYAWGVRLPYAETSPHLGDSRYLLCARFPQTNIV
eukprot:6183511-Pleurochrysis_carterae.AAC.2